MTSADDGTPSVGPTPPNALLYQVVAARRAQWDNLVWQVPVLSFTAQAFLFTICLGSGSSAAGRFAAAALSIVISVLSITLMARHRQAEMTDAKWLEKYELVNFPDQLPVHGEAWRRRRDATQVSDGVFALVPRWPGYKTWVTGLCFFLLAGVGALVGAAVALITG